MSWQRLPNTVVGKNPKDVLPDTPGCYAIYLNEVPVYVGKSNYLRSRLSGHTTLRMIRRAYRGIAIKIRLCPKPHYLEAYLLKRLNPVLNSPYPEAILSGYRKSYRTPKPPMICK